MYLKSHDEVIDSGSCNFKGMDHILYQINYCIHEMSTQNPNIVKPKNDGL